MFKNLLPVLLAMAALPAGATTTFYVGAAGETQFNLDLITRGLTVGSLIDFTGESSGLTLNDIGPSLVDFTGSSSIFVDGSMITLNGTSAVLQVSLPSDVYAIGMYISSATGNKTWSYGPSGGTIALTASTTFFGAMSTTPLAALPTLTLSGPVGASTGINVFNFELGTVSGGGGGGGSETPEPSTLVLLGSALIVLPVLARRKRTGSRTPPTEEL
jgi:hypothetical protein